MAETKNLPPVTPENVKTPEQLDAERMAKAQLQKTQLPAKDAPTEPKDGTPNFTRDALELQLASRYEAEGKSPTEAKALAKKRALEMIQ